MNNLRTIETIQEIDQLQFNKDGLIPVVCIDGDRMCVDGLRSYRMQAFANSEAVQTTLETGFATFWSRSRNELWTKGMTSGNTMSVRGIYADCDYDSLLFDVDARGPSCHTGALTCFELPNEGELM